MSALEKIVLALISALLMSAAVMTASESFTKLLGNGFTKDAVSNYKFHKENITITVLAMEGILVQTE